MSSGAGGSADLWQGLLRETAAKSKIKDSTLFLMGNRCAGKNSLLRGLRFRSTESQVSTGLLDTHNDSGTPGSKTPDKHGGSSGGRSGSSNSNSKSSSSGSGSGGGSSSEPGGYSGSHQFPEAVAFSYFSLFDPEDPDSDSLGLPTKVNVWTIGDEKHEDLLPVSLRNSDLANSAVVIVVNLSKPFNALADLHKWLEIVKQAFKKPFADLPLAQQDELKARLESLYQKKGTSSMSSVDKASNGNGSGDGDGAESKQSAEPAEPSTGSKVKHNLGVPIVVVGTQSDFLLAQRASPLTADQCDFLQMHLRRVCLQYGAALCYTSSVRGATNCTLLARYILHRLYPSQFNFTEKAEVIKKDAVFVPAGWDDPQKVEDILEDGADVPREANFNEVIKFPVGEEKTAAGNEKITAPSLKAPDYQQFLTTLSVLAPVTSSSTPISEQSSRKKKVAFLVNQAKGKSSASTPTGGAAALLARRSSNASPRSKNGSGLAQSGDGTQAEPDHSLLKNFFRGLMSRTGDRGTGGASAKDKKVKAKARDELKKMNGSKRK